MPLSDTPDQEARYETRMSLKRTRFPDLDSTVGYAWLVIWPLAAILYVLMEPADPSPGDLVLGSCVATLFFFGIGYRLTEEPGVSAGRASREAVQSGMRPTYEVDGETAVPLVWARLWEALQEVNHNANLRTGIGVGLSLVTMFITGIVAKEMAPGWVVYGAAVTGMLGFSATYLTDRKLVKTSRTYKH